MNNRRTMFRQCDDANPTPSDRALWRPTRRDLLKASAVAGSGFAIGGAPFLGTRRAAGAAMEQPKSGGTLTVSLTGLFDLAPAIRGDVTFDPANPRRNFLSDLQMALVYDQLVRLAPDGATIEPGLAESWEVSADGLTYTFRLRDAAFHDGSPVTSDDVIYSLGRVVEAKASPYLSGFTLEAPDAATVIAHLDGPWAPFLADLTAMSASIIPRKLHEARKLLLFDEPIGSGPFQFESWERGSQLVLVKNPGYWDAGKPYLDGVTLIEVWDDAERLARFRDGALDVAAGVPFDQLTAIRAEPNLAVLADTPAIVRALFINTSRPPFQDKALRQAINYAIDRQAIVREVLAGNGVPATTYLPPNAVGHDPAATGYSFDLDKAKSLVAQSAGKDGFTVEWIYPPEIPLVVRTAEIIANQLAQIGGKVTPPAPGLDIDALLGANQYDIWMDWWSPTIPDPDDLTTGLVRSDTGAAGFFSHFSDGEIDALAKSAPTMTDPIERAAAYNELQAKVNDAAPLAFLYNPGPQTATTAHVRDLRILPTGIFRLWEAWRDDA